MRFLMHSYATSQPCAFEMTLREDEHIHQRHFEVVYTHIGVPSTWYN